MSFPYLALAATLSLFMTLAVPGDVDWKAFEDPKAFLLTDGFAESIDKLPALDKATAIKRLHDSLEAKDVEIHRRAALTLYKLGDKAGVPTLIEDLAKATGRDRDNLFVALRIMKDDRAIPALRNALKDKSPFVRSIALSALGELKATKAYDDIVALTKDKGDEPTAKTAGTLNCFPIRPADSACYALGGLGDPRAIPILIDLINDKDVQTSAMQALEVLTKQKLGNDPEKWKKWWSMQGR